MIVLFTDFGLSGPYTGQMKAVLAERAPGVAVIDLFADAPSRDPRAAAYLLAAHAPWFAPGTVFLAVVDPGVGGARVPVMAAADGRWFVGPDNGLFALALRRAAQAELWQIDWRPERLAPSFHGRDLFAPVAAMIASGATPARTARPPLSAERRDWPDDLAEIVYVDHYGNAMTGLRASRLPPDARLAAGGQSVGRARVFADVPDGAALWYENSCGLAEIAVNRGRADRVLGLGIGSAVTVEN
ncbi:MAG TPA: SAM-dependent chlorinase/fluorinase [Stellaceae bacterium]|nr:SAM-dependent chlorinase/fluorinase [Stellaceae bacterium]